MSTTDLHRFSKNVIRKNLTLPLIQEHFSDISLKNWFNYIIKNKIHKKTNLCLYHSFGTSSWNGGRLNSIRLTDALIKKCARLNITLCPTFSNFNINVMEKEGNEILKKLPNNSEIILHDRNLLRHLHKSYPNKFITKFSITGHTNYPDFYTYNKNYRKIDRESIFEYYLNLFNEFDFVVIHSELALKRWFINFLKKNNLLHRAEVIINIINGCSYCPKYLEHYKLIAEENNKEQPDKNIMNCILEVPPQNFTKYFFNTESKKLIKKLYRIKFEGRTNFFKNFLKYHGKDLKCLL